MKYCPECGAKLNGTPKFCPECGTKLSEGSTQGSDDGFFEGFGDADWEELGRELDGQIAAENAPKEAYKKRLALARADAIRGKYKEAEEIYEALTEENPEDMNGYMGFIRVASENYTKYEGGGIEKSIRAAQEISGTEDLRGYDKEYAEYAARREKYFADKAAEKEKKIRERGLFEIEGGVLKKYKGNGGDVVIPEEVWEVGDSAFEKCRGADGCDDSLRRAAYRNERICPVFALVPHRASRRSRGARCRRLFVVLFVEKHTNSG